MSEVAEHEMDENGLPIVANPHPLHCQFKQLLRKVVLYLFIVPTFGSTMLLLRWIRSRDFREDVRKLYELVADAEKNSILKQSYFKDTKLLAKMWQLPSAMRYIRNGALMYQKTESFCGRATLRCMLKSFDRFPKSQVPKQKSGMTEPEKLCKSITELLKDCGEEIQVNTEIVSSDLGYDVFLKTVRRVNDENCRVAVNYLRPALVGFALRPRFFPTYFILNLFGGHFSPLVGILEQDGKPDDPLVAIFDVNHKYGTHLVPATRLYEAVHARDVFAGKSRACMVLEMPKVKGT